MIRTDLTSAARLNAVRMDRRYIMKITKIFQPLHKRTNPEDRKKAAQKTKDMSLLIRMIRRDPDIGVRDAAIRRVRELKVQQKKS